MGTHVLKTWSSTQAVISLSSGEAEYYAIVKAASMGLGMRSLAEDMGIAMSVDLFTDSSAAKGLAFKRGLGKARHIDTCYLWVQEKLVDRELYLHKVGTEDNLADLMTKKLDTGKHETIMGKMCMVSRPGRHRLAPAAVEHKA